MLTLTLINFLTYFSIAWGANIALNLLYVLKRYFPETRNWDYPMDCHLRYHGERLIGDSVTFLGLIVSIILSAALYLTTNNIMWAIIPLIVHLGDLLGSFTKRRLHKKNGEYLPLVDHGNYMILLGIVFVLVGYADLGFVLLALLLTYILHPIACYLAFKLKLRKNPY